MYKRIVVKVGTKVLSKDDGTIDAHVAEHLVEQIATAKKNGAEVILVTSGAVGTGRTLLTLNDADTIGQKQVFAAVGQVKLMGMYAELFGRLGYLCAQVLATKEDFRDRHHYLNMRNCLENLLRNDVVPVVNENDVVAVSELLFTDNDELAGLVASQLNADAVIILTSVDGVVAGDPHDPVATIVSEIRVLDIASFQKFITSQKSDFGRGGMLTKFAVAKKLATQGITTHIANGKKKEVLSKILDGKSFGTRFPAEKRLSSLKRRIAYSEGLSKGVLEVNQCTEEMLVSKKIMSLLPVGVTNVKGKFQKGDVVEIQNRSGKKLGFGVSRYDANKATAVAGKKNMRAVVNYDYLFIE